MVVGIGFVALLTAALAERFLAQGIREGVAEVQEEVADDREAAEAEILGELARFGGLPTRSKLARLPARAAGLVL